jgi:hypothetical protein
MSEDRDKNPSVEPKQHDDHLDACAGINDPIRKALCKACGLPVIGQAPFCKDHEPPAP